MGLLRRLTREHEPTEHDARIGLYIFSGASVAERDAMFRELVREEVDAGDVHLLEAAVEELRIRRSRKE